MSLTRPTSLCMAITTAALALSLAPSPAFADPSETKTASLNANATTTRVVLGRFATTYQHDIEHKTRAFNVELAAEALDNKTIAPGATFSFNDAVGERTAAFGFAKAVVLRDGMIAEGMGGGTCQVASTLHAAALLSALEIVSRAPHTRPSAYIRMGFDATVAFPSARGVAIDFKLRNPRSEPVTLHARAAKGSVEVWFDVDAGSGAGGASAAVHRSDVSLTSEIVDRTLFTRTIERDRSISDDKVHVKAFGIPGFRVRRTREVHAADGTVKRDVRVDVYPPTNEIVRVAPSFDESRLTLRNAGNGAELDPEDDTRAAPQRVIDASAIRPVLVQLRPSTQVIIDNSAH